MNKCDVYLYYWYIYIYTRIYNYIYMIKLYIHYIYIYGLCQKRNKWTIARWGYLRESTHSHASIHEGRNSLRLCLCPRQGKYRQRPLWFLAVFTSFDLIILCKLMINLINHGLWDSHGDLMAGLFKSGMCNPPYSRYSRGSHLPKPCQDLFTFSERTACATHDMLSCERCGSNGPAVPQDKGRVPGGSFGCQFHGESSW